MMTACKLVCKKIFRAINNRCGSYKGTKSGLPKHELEILARHFLPQIQAFFEKVGQQPLAWISERAAYGQLAQQGLNIFDKPQKTYLSMQDQWQPVLNAIVEDPSNWF